MHKIKVLLIEDSLLSRKVVKTMLEGFDCQVDIAATGEEGIVLSQKNHYDLMLIDIGLPGIDGIMTAKLIRDQGKTDYHTPIIALIAHNDSELREEAIAAGMNDILVKPLNGFIAEEILSHYCHSTNLAKHSQKGIIRKM